MTRPRNKSRRKRDLNPGSSALEADALLLGQRVIRVVTVIRTVVVVVAVVVVVPG